MHTEYFQKYTDFTDTTAVYSEPETNFTYPILGLADESYEVWKAISAYVSDDSNENLSDLLYELGDLAYYVARLNRVFSLQLLKYPCMGGSCSSESTPLSKSPGKSSEEAGVKGDLMHLSYELIDHSLTLTGRFKKYVRGDFGFQDIRSESFIKLRDILKTLDTLAQALDTNLQDICLLNEEKLTSRKQRGVLQGDGGHR